MSSLDSFLDKFGAGISSEESPAEPLSADAPDALAKFLDKWNGGMDEKSYFFYNNTIELRFDKDSWTYYKVGPLGELEPQDGITSTLKIIDKSAALVPWGCKMMFESIVRLVPTFTKDGIEYTAEMSMTDFLEILTEAKAAHKNRLEEAGDIGHQAHQCLEDSIRFALAHDPEKIVRSLVNLPKDERAVTCAKEAKLWMDAHHVRWIETERKVYSRTHKVAGTMDGLCLVNSCCNPTCCPVPFVDRLSIADWKTSNTLQVPYNYQTAIYLFAYCEENGPGVTDRFILRLGKEKGDFEPRHLPWECYEADLKGFLSALQLLRDHRAVEERTKQTNKEASGRRKAAKLAAKETAKEVERLEKAKDKAEKKAVREIEKARVKAEAKIARDAEKAAAKAAKLAPKVMPKLESQAGSSGAERDSYKVIVEGSIPSQPTTFEEAVEIAETECRLAGLPKPNKEVLRSDPEVKAVLAGLREEAPVQRRPFIIPEEG